MKYKWDFIIGGILLTFLVFGVFLPVYLFGVKRGNSHCVVQEVSIDGRVINEYHSIGRISNGGNWIRFTEEKTGANIMFSGNYKIIEEVKQP